MARGGARPGAGRKTGAKTQKSRDIAIAASQDGVTPIEVMLWSMREIFEAAKREPDPDEKLKLAKSAADAADKAAPYVHPRMAPKPPEEDNEKTLTVIIQGGLTDGDNSQSTASPSGAIKVMETKG